MTQDFKDREYRTQEIYTRKALPTVAPCLSKVSENWCRSLLKKREKKLGKTEHKQHNEEKERTKDLAALKKKIQPPPSDAVVLLFVLLACPLLKT